MSDTEQEETTIEISLRQWRRSRSLDYGFKVKTKGRDIGLLFEEGKRIRAAFTRFIKRARIIAPKVRGRKMDICVSIWTFSNKYEFLLPKSLMKLAGEQGWSITVFVNN